MKSLISALVISAASILPVNASLHDFNPSNVGPTQQRPKTGQGQCIDYQDKSELCFVKFGPSQFSIAIFDIDDQRSPMAVQINCRTGQWHAYGSLTKPVVESYLDNFCPQYG